MPGVPGLIRVGHKGADHVAPGNTIESFEAALEHGVDMIEFDVLRTRDGRLVLAHDAEDAAGREPLSLEQGLDHFAGDHRWALAIITITIIVRTLLLPIAVRQIKSMREQQRLQPEVARLRQKYRSDRQKMTQEMMALYQREGVNPYAACLQYVVRLSSPWPRARMSVPQRRHGRPVRSKTHRGESPRRLGS